MARVFALIAVLLLPTLAGAAELNASLSAGAGYDSNVFNSEVDAVNDGSFSISPRLTLAEAEGRLQYRLDYSALWEKYLERQVADRIDDVDHTARVNISYALTPKTQIFVADTFRLTNNLNGTTTVFDPESVPLVQDGRFQTLLNSVSAGASHRFSSRMTGTLTGNYNTFDSKQPNSIGSQQFGAYADLGYQLPGGHSVGAGANFSYQDFEEVQFRPSSDTQIVNISARYAKTIGERTRFSIAAGPAFIFSSQRSSEFNETFDSRYPRVLVNNNVLFVPNPAICGATAPIYTSPECTNLQTYVPVFNDAPNDPFSAFNQVAANETITIRSFDPGGDSTRITLFATASIHRAWTRNLSSSLSYRRSQGQSQGTGTSTIRDLVSFNNDWTVGEYWSFQLRAAWVQRTSVNPESERGLGIRIVDDNSMMTPLVQYTGTVLSTSKNTTNSRWEIGLRTTRRLTERLLGDFDLIYLRQQDDRGESFDTVRSYDKILAVLTLRYNFAPIRVPIPDV